MIENREEFNDTAVDRVEEVLVTRQPGYAATEQVVRDVAAERRMGLVEVNRILWSMLGFLEILLIFRVILKYIAANPDSGFSILIYSITGFFVSPFNGLIATPTSGGSILEVTTLIAMVVYALMFWGVVYVIRLVVNLPGIRSFTLITHEQKQDREGNVHTTHTTTITNGKI